MPRSTSADPPSEDRRATDVQPTYKTSQQFMERRAHDTARAARRGRFPTITQRFFRAGSTVLAARREDRPFTQGRHETVTRHSQPLDAYGKGPTVDWFG